MALTTDRFVASRSFAFHICGEVNFASIRATRALLSAESLLRATEQEPLLRGRRSETVAVSINGQLIQIRDHKPLIPANIELLDGYTLGDFVGELNSRVFLWAGTNRGPCDSGRRHIAKYQAEGETFILRVPTSRLLSENTAKELEVTFCNSGAARYHTGQRAKRGRSTFVALGAATRNPGDVVELTFKHSVALPRETQYARALSGPWLSLATDA